jgi:hypothetical protein
LYSQLIIPGSIHVKTAISGFSFIDLWLVVFKTI